MAPPKNKGGSKKPKEDEATGSKKSKDAQSINVRHILVGTSILDQLGKYLTSCQCEKFSKKEEALAKVKAGEGFDKVAREMSEDKARQGMAATQSTDAVINSIDPCCSRFVRLEDQRELRPSVRGGRIQARPQHRQQAADRRGQNRPRVSNFHPYKCAVLTPQDTTSSWWRERSEPIDPMTASKYVTLAGPEGLQCSQEAQDLSFRRNGVWSSWLSDPQVPS